jgi:hypothetical protein
MISALDVDGTILASDALAACLLREDITRAECDAIVYAGRTVPGRYCTGRLFLDADGRRCVPAAELDAKARAAAASPLPTRPVTSAAAPMPAPRTIALVAAAILLAWVALR